MRKLAGLLGFLALFAMPAMAQGAGETPSVELSGGFAHRSYYELGGATLGMNGWFASVDYNVMRRLGVEVEILGVRANQPSAGPLQIYTGMVGPRIYPFGHRKITPFAHVLYGEGYYRLAHPAFGGFPYTVNTNHAAAWEAGGGLDWALSKHWGVRLIQFDFGATKFFGGRPSQGSYRTSVGFVYRIGNK